MSDSPPSTLTLLWTGYQISLITRPITTKVVTASVLASLASIVSQKAVIRSKQIDWKPVATFASFAVIQAPLIHSWYGILDKLFAGKTGTTVALSKLALDQLIFSPFLTSLFFSYLELVNGKPESIPDTISKQLLPCMKMSWKVWPITQWINFTFVPPHLRVLFGNFVGFLWSIYMASLMAKQQKKDEEHSD
mmetsp:Transcript_33507/g.84111  ORF Transcript_33507/g.84111 Transcript_33507/m.84111 type:complete len:192 (+) Transcript_33507:1126-1701(+)